MTPEVKYVSPYLLRPVRELTDVLKKFRCQWCGAKTRTLAGQCHECGRFGYSTDAPEPFPALARVRCKDCGGLVNDDGMTIDPEKCCFYCKAD